MAMNRMRGAVLAAAVAGVLAGTLAGAARGEDLKVQAQAVEIRSGKGAIYPVLATAKQGQVLHVVAREGKWVKVQLGSQTGYVYSDAAAQAGGGGDLFAAIGSASGSGMSTGAAGKGLGADAEQYAAAKGMSSAALNQLIAQQRNPATAQQRFAAWDKFTAEGHVGPHKP